MTILKAPKTLKEYGRIWPPNVTMADPGYIPIIPPKADLRDVVLAADNPAGQLRVRLRSSESLEYTILLSVPESTRRRTLADIRNRLMLRASQKNPVTLGDIGELPMLAIKSGQGRKSLD